MSKAPLNAEELTEHVVKMAEDVAYSMCGYDWNTLTMSQALAVRGALDTAAQLFHRTVILPFTEVLHIEATAFTAWLEDMLDPADIDITMLKATVEGIEEDL